MTSNKQQLQNKVAIFDFQKTKYEINKSSLQEASLLSVFLEKQIIMLIDIFIGDLSYKVVITCFLNC